MPSVADWRYGATDATALCWLSAVAIASMLAEGTLTSRDVVAAQVQRIRQMEDQATWES